MKNDLVVDLRQLANETITIKVVYKNYWWLYFGMLVIQLGCFICGAKYQVEEDHG